MKEIKHALLLVQLAHLLLLTPLESIVVNFQLLENVCS
jgi:hypothetical protein